MGAIGGMLRLATSNQGDDEEIKIGEGVAASVLGAAKPSSNAKLNNYLNLVGNCNCNMEKISIVGNCLCNNHNRILKLVSIKQ